MAVLLRLGRGLGIGDAGTQQVQLALALILPDQVGDKGFHRAALHGGYRQFGRGNQQNPRLARRVGGEQRQNGTPFFV